VTLNPAQEQAVHTLSGPLLVLAGAGSGKTRVVTLRIKELIASGISPERILAVTFTNKAAREMATRTTELLKNAPLGPSFRRKSMKPEVSTLHSLCVRVLRRHADRLGYPKHFTICDAGDQESVARAALRAIKVGDQALKPAELLSRLSGFKSKGFTPIRALEESTDDREQLAALAFARYQDACGCTQGGVGPLRSSHDR
jgi:DNA helicase II / ATP-dependent DNA helicase PcrA